MDWEAAVEKNKQALMRILAMLVSMAALDERSTMTRYLHGRIVGTLHPIESAVRRLVVIAARGIAVKWPTLRKAPLRPPLADTVVTAMHCGVFSRFVWKPGAQFPKITPLPPRPLARLSLPMFDDHMRPWRVRRHYTPDHAAPRITAIGLVERRPDPPPPPVVYINTERLGQRLDAVGRVLADLPGHARKFARWRARRDAVIAALRAFREGKRDMRPHFGRPCTWPFKTGSPPGVPKPHSHLRETMSEAQHIALELHHLACDVLDAPRVAPDTS